MSADKDVAVKLEAIARDYGLAAVYVFGSRAGEIAALARGQEIMTRSPRSDIDIGIQPGKHRPLSAEDRVKLTIEMEDLFDAKRVDLVILPEADPYLALDIIRGELLHCADADEEAEYELFVLRRAADLAPYAREKWREILGGTGP
jgi:predicted nucleotidyltransferase